MNEGALTRQALSAYLPKRLGGFLWMAEIVPEGKVGKATVEHFVITKDTFQGWQSERTRPGRYALLRVGGSTVMSDTDREMRTNLGPLMDARGDVLLGGLGLGLMVLPLVFKPQVTSVTVVEVSRDVCGLVLSPLQDFLRGKFSAQTGQQYSGKFRIELGDVRKWKPAKPGRQFDYLYFDIWGNRNVDNVDEMKELHRAYRRYLRPGGKVTSWDYDHLRYLKSQGRWR